MTRRSPVLVRKGGRIVVTPRGRTRIKRAVAESLGASRYGVGSDEWVRVQRAVDRAFINTARRRARERNTTTGFQSHKLYMDAAKALGASTANVPNVQFLSKENLRKAAMKIAPQIPEPQGPVELDFLPGRDEIAEIARAESSGGPSEPLVIPDEKARKRTALKRRMLKQRTRISGGDGEKPRRDSPTVPTGTGDAPPPGSLGSSGFSGLGGGSIRISGGAGGKQRRELPDPITPAQGGGKDPGPERSPGDTGRPIRQPVRVDPPKPSGPGASAGPQATATAAESAGARLEVDTVTLVVLAGLGLVALKFL